MSSVIGTRFVVMTFGESHGAAVGAVIDGCPSRLELAESDIQPQLDRRRPGQSKVTTRRREADRVQILSGVDSGVTLGTPIALVVRNTDKRSMDYAETLNIPRPSHADFTYRVKYGVVAQSGGGRASARETVGRVAAGAVADKLLKERHGIQITAWVSSIGCTDAPDMTGDELCRGDVDTNDVRCPHGPSAKRMARDITSALKRGDSLGGIITCVCRNVPPGLGEPVFGKASSMLGAAMLSIPACKGFEIGSGFAGTRMCGSRHNDLFTSKSGGLGTSSNRSGGIQGGITNGQQIVFRVAFKPPASISRPQRTVDYDGGEVVLRIKGRHDPCVVPRAVPVVESMAALVLADLALMAG